uniref:Uncharacterized protein n=1 Tax=Anguilla anguilla TaxID=7936 RepID=A0A0E9XKL5_ANGAN
MPSLSGCLKTGKGGMNEFSFHTEETLTGKQQGDRNIRGQKNKTKQNKSLTRDSGNILRSFEVHLPWLI